MNKTSGGDGIPTELFKIPEDDALKLLIMPAKLENSAVATGPEKITFHSSPKEGQYQKCSNYCTIDLISHAAAAAAKSLQSCLTLCNPIDGSPPGSSVPGILQARILEWVAISFSRSGGAGRKETPPNPQ